MDWCRRTRSWKSWRPGGRGFGKALMAICGVWMPRCPTLPAAAPELVHKAGAFGYSSEHAQPDIDGEYVKAISSWCPQPYQAMAHCKWLCTEWIVFLGRSMCSMPLQRVCQQGDCELSLAACMQDKCDCTEDAWSCRRTCGLCRPHGRRMGSV